MKAQAILLIDGSCVLCSRLVAFIQPRLKPSTDLRFIALESNEGASIFQTFPDRVQNIDSLIFSDGRTVRTRSSAVLQCLRLMEWRYAMWSPFLWVIPLPFRNFIYQLVAKSRHKIFQKLDVCTSENCQEKTVNTNIKPRRV
jgi:predicted DCC family thiol-disulfide oxidoreductase YuxK